MLSTFENSGRQHLRRKERERHIRQIEAFANSLDFISDDTAACSLAVDTFSGNPLEKIPEDHSVHNGTTVQASSNNDGWWKSKRGTTVIIAVLGLFGLTMIGFLLGVDVGEQQLSIQQAIVTPNAEASGTEVDATLMVRHKTILSLVLDWGISSSEALQDPSSHAARALDWLIYTDLDTTGVETIRTRFALASLFFATQRPDQGNTWTEDRHWLSSYPVCLWYGVECLDERETMGLVQSLNLSSNALTGSIPEEIGLLGLDIRSLDLSDNQLVGTIPETTFLLRNLSTWQGMDGIA